MNEPTKVAHADLMKLLELLSSPGISNIFDQVIYNDFLRATEQLLQAEDSRSIDRQRERILLGRDFLSFIHTLQNLHGKPMNVVHGLFRQLNVEVVGIDQEVSHGS